MAHPASRLKTTIAIVGCGDVGATLAYTLLLNPICTEVILVDPKEDLLEAQVRDLRDASSRGSSGTRIRGGTHKEAGQADIVVITAGAKQKKGKSSSSDRIYSVEAPDDRIGEDRISLLSRNLHILKSIFDSMQPLSQDTVLLMVANPVDILTHFARKLSGLPPSQVLGTGTSLDSARLRGILSQKLDVAPNSINAFVLGEHGENQFVAWSNASVGTTSLSAFIPASEYTDAFRSSVADETRGSAGQIIAAKGSTNFGIGNIAASICKYILFDQRTVRPISFYQEELGVTLSMPAILGRKGVLRPVQIELDEAEKKRLGECADALRKVAEEAEGEVDKVSSE